MRSSAAFKERVFLERAFSTLLILVLLGGGLLLGRSLDRARPPNRNPQIVTEANVEPTVFRNWLWERRGLDLLVQVALVFAGTLGVAAILPNSGEGPALPAPRADD